MEQPESNEITAVAEPCDTDLKDHDRYLRLLADFDNYRRRVERERASAAYIGKRSLILVLLEVLDDFERALLHIGDAPSALAGGLHAIHRKLAGLIEAEGVRLFDSLGKVFDPSLHEAVGSVSDGRYPSGVIVEEVRRGYRWGDELLRPAQVIIAR
jgi:molecular chaperone GrpE